MGLESKDDDPWVSLLQGQGNSVLGTGDEVQDILNAFRKLMIKWQTYWNTTENDKFKHSSGSRIIFYSSAIKMAC